MTLHVFQSGFKITFIEKHVLQVFANNPTISGKVTHDDIRQILYTALSGDSAEHSDLLTVLRTIVKVTELH